VKFVNWLLEKTGDSPIHVDYNFFPSNHGYSICDVMGSQAQRNINVTQRDEKVAIRTPSDLCKAIQRSTKVTAIIAPAPVDVKEVRSIPGIQTWHRLM
jgi:hypothetical protein